MSIYMYLQKYLKYKTKYTNLKKMVGGKLIPIVVHFYINNNKDKSMNIQIEDNIEPTELSNYFEKFYYDNYGKTLRVDKLFAKTYSRERQIDQNISFYIQNVGKFDINVYFTVANEKTEIISQYKNSLLELNNLLNILNNKDVLNVIILYSYVTRDSAIDTLQQVEQQIPEKIVKNLSNYKKINIILVDMMFNQYKNMYIQPFFSLYPIYNNDFRALNFKNIHKFDFNINNNNECVTEKCVEYAKHLKLHSDDYQLMHNQINKKYSQLRDAVKSNSINFYTVNIISPNYNNHSEDAKNITKIQNLAILNFTGEVFYDNTDVGF